MLRTCSASLMLICSEQHCCHFLPRNRSVGIKFDVAFSQNNSVIITDLNDFSVPFRWQNIRKGVEDDSVKQVS